MTMNHTEADNLLADALWWFKGFRAAQPADARDPTEALGDSLRSVREWLNRLPLGLNRLLGTSERTFACVITEHELEVIIDGLRENTGEDRELALAKVREIHKQFVAECKEVTRRPPVEPIF